MRELAALERRVDGISAGLVPSIVATLRRPGAATELGPALRNNPELRNRILEALASDAALTPQLIALAGRGDDRAPWFGRAMEALLARGDVASVRRLHERAAPGRGLGGQLRPWQAGPAGPLAWRFPQGRGGLAEPVEGGPLRLVHYGREESILAEHRLLLAPRRYRLVQRFAADVQVPAFEWRLTCLPGTRSIGTIPAGRSTIAGTFAVTRDCPVQILSLVASPRELAATIEAELLSVTLEPAGASGG
jgi:hypothetical protein